MANSCTTDLSGAYQALRAWLTVHAHPVWWTHGADHVRGGFHERLHLNATPTEEPRRARLHPRQIFAYSNASEMGWNGPAGLAVEHALDFFLARYRRPDGLYRACVAPDGTARDERALLYDQAFALLGFASAHALGIERNLPAAARELHESVQSALTHAGGAFETNEERTLPLQSNPHMHLLEASLAWFELDADGRWLALAQHIVNLSLERWIDARTGAIREFFDSDWQPAVTGGRNVEPGHQFEWAWLLLRFAKHRADARLAPAALRLIEFGETYGVDRARRVAMNACLDNGEPLDRFARLWPQTERIRAACGAAELTGDPRYLHIALEATQVLISYFDVPVRGLWRDCMRPDGEFVEEPAPASSLYHIVGAAVELRRLLRET